MFKCFEIKFMLAAVMLYSAPLAYAQKINDAALIAASQDGASPLVYTVGGRVVADISMGCFQDGRECNVRDGLPGFFDKVSRGEAVTVAFVGGSITQGDYCYRLQISRFMEKKWPGVSFTWLNAGVSGTGTDLGAFRIGEQVLRYDPDLVFLEFAVNGAYPEGLEGMVRKIRKNNPSADICLIYAMNSKQKEVYQDGGVPQEQERLEKVAEHYSLPSIHLGMEAAMLEKSGKLVWKGDADGGKLLFSNDGLHPIAAGGNLYAAAIARGLEKMSGLGTAKPHVLPSEPLFGTRWDDADMYLPSEIAMFDGNWKEIQTGSRMEFKKFSGWFDTVLVSDRKESVMHFAFEGDMFGLFDIGGPESGQLEVIVDGQLVKLKPCSKNGFGWLRANDIEGDYTLNRFSRWCNNRYRGQYFVVEVPYGRHQVTLRISSVDANKKSILDNADDIVEHPEKYDRTAIYVGRILLRGRPLEVERIKGVPKLQQQLKWDDKLARFREQDRQDPPRDGAILFVGSSTIENWKTVQSDFSGKYVLNRGVSGTKTIDMINYSKYLISPYSPKQVFLYPGDNDIGYGWTPEEIMEQVRKLFSIVRTEKPDAEIIFISIKPCPRRMKDIEKIVATNALIKELAQSRPDTEYADVFSAMLEGGGLHPEYYREDGLHLTAEGYKVWQKVVSDFIK